MAIEPEGSSYLNASAKRPFECSQQALGGNIIHRALCGFGAPPAAYGMVVGGDSSEVRFLLVPELDSILLSPSVVLVRFCWVQYFHLVFLLFGAIILCNISWRWPISIFTGPSLYRTKSGQLLHFRYSQGRVYWKTSLLDETLLLAKRQCANCIYGCIGRWNVNWQSSNAPVLYLMIALADETLLAK